MKNILSKFIDTVNLIGYEINNKLSNDAKLINLVKFKLNSKNEEEIVDIIKKEKLLENITSSQFNQPYQFKGVKETLINYLLNDSYFKVLNEVLDFSDIDFNQSKDNTTYLQSAIVARLDNKIIAKLVKKIPIELIDVQKELSYFITYNSLMKKDKSYMENIPEDFKNVLNNYVQKFKHDLSLLSIVVGEEKKEILVFCHALGAHTALKVLLDLHIFSKEQIENAMNVRTSLNPLFLSNDFFEPYLIEKEKQKLDTMLNNENKTVSKKVKI
jgi:hypothetical protein